MNVGEIIAELEKFPKSLPVCDNDFGAIMDVHTDVVSSKDMYGDSVDTLVVKLGWKKMDNAVPMEWRKDKPDVIDGMIKDIVILLFDNGKMFESDDWSEEDEKFWYVCGDSSFSVRYDSEYYIGWMYASDFYGCYGEHTQATQ